MSKDLKVIMGFPVEATEVFELAPGVRIMLWADPSDDGECIEGGIVGMRGIICCNREVGTAGMIPMLRPIVGRAWEASEGDEAATAVFMGVRV